MSDDLELAPIDPKGFWAFVNEDGTVRRGGFVTTVQIGPFDYLRVDYPPQGYWINGEQVIRKVPNLYDGKVMTVLYAPGQLPDIRLASREEVYGLGKFK